MRALLDEIGIPQRSRRGSFEAILGLADALPRGRALDLPCGPGLLSEALRRLGFQVEAADLDPTEFAAGSAIPVCAADLDAPLPYADGRFDLVVCADGIEHVENPFLSCREFARVLAAEGRLIIATPHYLNLERRLKFLFTGSLARPVARSAGPRSGHKRDRGHINPLTLTRLAAMAEEAGLRLETAFTIGPKRRQLLLAPLAACIRLYGALLRPARRRDLFAEQTFSWRMLLGGKVLIAVFRSV